jgi:hypothetical protein
MLQQRGRLAEPWQLHAVLKTRDLDTANNMNAGMNSV